jgi:glycosyltransferase involved in cell wall biosynthesis
MRVAIDCRYVRERPSGIGAYVRELVDRVPELAPCDHFRLWVDPRADRPLSRGANVGETLVDAPANGLTTLLFPSALAALDDVDVLHAPFNILGRGLGLPAVVTIHDLMWLVAPDLAEGRSVATPFKAAFYRNGICRALERASRLVAISNATADAVARWLPEARPRVRVIPHGIGARYRPGTGADPARERVARRFGVDAPYFLVVGQNTPSKNHVGVLRAFAWARLPAGTRLVVLHRLYAGRRHSGASLREHAVRLDVGARTTLLSSATDDDVVDLLRGALALVQFSRFEGFGLPALEAMACGTPVIASDIPALVEVLGGAGVHAPLSVPALASALERVATDRGLRAELSARGIERCRAFSWRRSAELHLEVYREAAGTSV